MEILNKQQLLSDIVQQATQQLNNILNDFKPLSCGKLNYIPAAGKWSAAQCLKHLNTYSEYYLPRIQAALQSYNSSDEAPTFKSSWIGGLFVRMMENKTLIKKFKAVKRHVPPVQLDGAKEVASFINHQEQLISLINASRRANLEQIIIPMSINPLLKINLGDLLRFQVVHTSRHLTQAREVLVSAAL